MIRFFVVVLLFGLFGCHREETSRHGSRRLTLQHRQETFGTFGFLSRVEGMLSRDGLLYLPDYEHSRVLLVNEQLEPVSQVGRHGSGPGELDLSGQSQIAQGRLFVNSPGTRQMMVYDLTGTFLDRIALPVTLTDMRFAVIDETLFISAPRHDPPISAVGMDGEVLYRFGKAYPTNNSSERRSRNYNHLSLVELDDQTMLLALSQSEPILALYSLEGEVKFYQNLEEMPFLPEYLEIIQQRKDADPQSHKRTYILFTDMEVRGDMLTVLIAGLHPPYRFLRFKLDHAGAAFVECLEIQEDLDIHTFASSGNQLFLFNGSESEMMSYR